MLKVYRASAGSGKTFRLTRDYIRLLFDADKSNHHRRILAVTFTNKATEEMKSRILLELHQLAKGAVSPYREELMEHLRLTEEDINSKAAKILINILHDYSSFSISTIDRFFQQVIRAFARDIGVHGGYALELDSGQVLDQSVDNLFFDLAQKENKQLLEWLTQYAEERIEQSEHWNMRPGIIELGYEIFKESYQHKASETNEKLHNKEFLQAYRKHLSKIADDFTTKAKNAANTALRIIDDHGLTTEDFKGSSRSGMKNLEKIAAGQMELKDSFVKMMDDVQLCYTAKTTPADKINAIEQAFYNGLQREMLTLKELFEKDFLFYNTVFIIRKHLNTLGILSDLAVQIKKLTTEQNIMLIADSNLLLNRIIDNSDTPFIYEKTGIYIDHFMIDEFQDTSVLQWKNFLPLISNSLSSGNFNLVVGDVKQSIYRWRNSDWKLLDSQIYTDFKHENIKDESLATNWRSDANIIHFNNALFNAAAKNLQEKLNENISPVLPALPGLTDLQDKISRAYQQTTQEVSKKAKSGHVTVNFIDSSESDESWKAISLNRLPALLEKYQSMGYKPCDIAILVRKNDEEQQLIQKLLHYKTTPEAKPGFSYDIMGTEGLMIESAATVRFLLGIMQLLINPNDAVIRTIVNYEYARGKIKLSENEALSMAGSNHEVDESGMSSLFTEEEKASLMKLKHFSLFEMTEQIISLFDLPGWHQEVVFLQAFQDAVYKFSTGKTSDLNSFLQWWKKSGKKQYISTPENEQAFRIMTIHKSKGLDFKVVIIPFCDWDLDSRMRNILWCETNVAPFNELPLMPVEYSSRLGETIFAEDYFREMMHTYIDNLNIAYVAFTRAKHELVCMCPLPKKDKNGNVSAKTLSSLMYNCFQSSQVEFLTEHFHSEENTYEAGTDTIYESSIQPVNENTEKLRDYPTPVPGNRLKIKHKIGSINREQIDVTENPLDYGNLMHEIFSRMNGEEDAAKTIDSFIREGRVNETEAEEIRAEIIAFWEMRETKEWFKEGVQVLNETTILTPEGYQYRPDRIIIERNKATVIDYKFGEHELPSYERQVINYTNLLNRMGYETSAYLCYVKLKKVVEVS
ncbi:MAG: UvrD-helicase domain-containing protein [Paludibacter sp.]|nr:UvrD-helicase domain-containing protein [Paludibacter sp.]